MRERIRESKTKMYLGDGLYADVDGGALVLTVENGIAVTNRVVLEPRVYTMLAAYAAVMAPPVEKKA